MARTSLSARCLPTCRAADEHGSYLTYLASNTYLSETSKLVVIHRDGKKIRSWIFPSQL